MEHLDFHLLYLLIIFLLLALSFSFLLSPGRGLGALAVLLLPQWYLLFQAGERHRRRHPARSYVIANELLVLAFASATYGAEVVWR